MLDLVTVTGTENLMMAAACARGESVIENAAREPEVVDLANFLNAMGAKIEGAGSDTIRIQGVERLVGASYDVMPDRIESGHLPRRPARSRAGACGSRARTPEHLDAVLQKLAEAGARIERGADWVELDMRGRAVARRGPQNRAVPGLPDRHAGPVLALNAVADGTASITETIFENRFQHALELQRLGANLVDPGQHGHHARRAAA